MTDTEKIFESERLYYRAWVKDDAARLYELCKNPNIGPRAGWPPHTSVIASAAIIMTGLSKPETFAICLKDGTLVGAIGIKTGEDTDLAKGPDECELGYWIGEEYWGRGYMPEAVNAAIDRCKNVLHMKKIWCAYYNGNAQSKRVQEKCGFVFHHEVKNYYVKALDEYRDMTVNILDR